YNDQYREDDLKFHVDSVLSPVLMNQFSIVGEHAMSSNQNVANAPRVSVAGYFSTGSAQSQSRSTDYNLRLYDSMSYTRGRQFIKFGIGIPHMNRRAFDDNTNVAGSYTFSPVMADDGVTVLH